MPEVWTAGPGRVIWLTPNLFIGRQEIKPFPFKNEFRLDFRCANAENISTGSLRLPAQEQTSTSPQLLQ